MVWNRGLLVGGGGNGPATIYGSHYLSGSSGNYSLPYTVSGQNRALFLFHHATGATITGATLDGVAGVLVDSIIVSGGGRVYVYRWLQSALPSANGNYNITVAGAAGTDDDGTIFLSDVNQGNPVRAVVKAETTTSSATINQPITIAGHAGLTTLFGSTAQGSSPIALTKPAALSTAGKDDNSGAVSSAEWITAVADDSEIYTYSFTSTGGTPVVNGAGVVAVVLNGTG